MKRLRGFGKRSQMIVNITEEMYEKLKDTAENNNVTVSMVVRVLLETHIEEAKELCSKDQKK